MAKNADLKESEAALKIMADDTFKLDFSTILRTRYPLFYVTTNEEKRFLQFISHFVIVNGYVCYWWDCFHGVFDLISKQQKASADDTMKNPVNVLEHIINHAKTFLNNKKLVDDKRKEGIRGYIYILLDYHRFIQEDPDVERRLKAIAKLDSIVATIITGPSYKTTDTLENLIPVLDFPYPNRDEIKNSLWQVVDSVSKKVPEAIEETEKIEEVLINSVSGLSLMEAQTAFSKSIVAHKHWDIPTLLKEKKQIISKSGILEYYDNTVPIDHVGGLKNLVNWIKKRKASFSKAAEQYGIKKPRGILLLGMPGSGKSLTCKAVANLWKMPLLRLDFGKLFDSLMGQSEARARDAIKLAETIAPCVLWIDEIEKALSGARSSGRTDGGTTSRVLGTFLTWMQEKTSPVFVVATANDHEAIPAEFLRAGRFDEIFFVDLPNRNERVEIFAVLLRLKNYKPDEFNLELLADSSKEYSGAEMEKAIENAMLVGFHDNERMIKDDDIINELSKFKSLFQLRNEDFTDLRDWANERCVKANQDEIITADAGLEDKRTLDLE